MSVRTLSPAEDGDKANGRAKTTGTTAEASASTRTPADTGTTNTGAATSTRTTAAARLENCD